MKYKTKSTTWDKIEADVLVLFASEDSWKDELANYDKVIGNHLLPHLKIENFEAKKGKIHTFPTFNKISARKLLITGVGKAVDFNLNIFREVLGSVAQSIKHSNTRSLAVNLVYPLLNKENTANITQTAVEAIELGSYHFKRYKKQPVKPEFLLDTIYLLTQPAKIQYFASGIKTGEIFSEAAIFARDLVNEPASVTTPEYLAQVAKSIVRNTDIRVEIYAEKEIRKMGMNAYLAVAQGSGQKPKLIKLIYKGGKEKIILVGKTITFDTGGLSLKDSKSMETMKTDMSGGASVLGIFQALSRLKPKCTVMGLIPACENMPGSNATKPGDIVKAVNGKTIEILNTDAEGRLTLADALSLAVKEKPDAIIDIATLTGACIAALGEDVAGLFCNNQKVLDQLLAAGKNAGEQLWQLPLVQEYKELIKSDLADLRNIGKNRYAGAITAALFLEEFVDNIPWAHLDIAGPAFAEKDLPFTPKGGTGFGVRTLLNFIQEFKS